MACETGTWIAMRTVGEGATIAQLMKCNGCAAWWVIFHGPGIHGEAYTIDQADGSEDAFRQALEARFAR